MDGDEYWYKLSEVSSISLQQQLRFAHFKCFQSGEAIRTAPFLHPILQTILRKELFDGRSGLYKLFPEEFEGEPGEKEMPPVLIALAATFVSFASIWHPYLF